MTILWLNWRDIKNPTAGGAEVMTHETTKRLAKAGHKVTILTSKSPNSKDEEVIDGVRIIRRGNRLTCRFWAFLSYLTKFKGKVDVVIDEINTIPFFTNLYVKEEKVALIHQLAKEYWWSETFFPVSLVGFLLEPFYLKLYRNMPTIVASESTKKDLKKLGFRKVFVFHQGLSLTPLTKLPQKPKKPQILFIGRLTKPKGPKDAVLAFVRIKKEFKTSKLTMCVRGSESAINKLKNLIKNLKLEDCTDIFGSIDLKRKLKLLEKTHLILIPSLREGWGLVAIEANAFGAVPIGYNVGGLCDSIQDGKTGILCKENNPFEMANAAISLLSNQKLYQKLASSGLLWSKRFNWDKTDKSFLEILREVCPIPSNG